MTFRHILLIFFFIFYCADSFANPVVVSSLGEIEGETLNNVDIFKGIPYAQEISDDLRFSPPLEKKAFKDRFIADKYCPIAPQAPFLNYTSTKSTGPNYLCLNIFRPKDAGKESKLPVFVWIHGGAFAYGAGSIPLYDGSQFARDGVITVTLNYRLGAEGFLFSKSLYDRYGSAGNLGFMDLMLALKWVHNHIDCFGGDPENVTVGGESAGAMATSSLLFSSELNGLFQKAVLQSGTLISYPFIGFSTEQNHALAKTRSAKLLSEFFVDDSDTGMDMLKTLDPYLLSYHCVYDYDFVKNTGTFMIPYLDGNILPESPYNALRSGKFNDISVLMGYNTDEGSMFVNREISDKELETAFYANFDEMTAEKLKAVYLKQDDESAYKKAYTFLGDVMFNLGMKIFADNLSQKQKVYFYHFDYVPNKDKKYGTGVAHSSEIKYSFNNLPKDASDKQKDIAQVFHMRLVNFMKTGDPNYDGNMRTLIKWTPYNTEDNAVLRIGSYTGIEPFKLKDRLDKLEKIIFEKN